MEHLRESEPVAQVREDTEVPESIIMVESNSLSGKKKKKTQCKTVCRKMQTEHWGQSRGEGEGEGEGER